MTTPPAAGALPASLAVLGTGNVGRTLARAWVDAGVDVTLAGRDPGRTADAAATAGATPATPADAVAQATVVVVAVPSVGLDDATRVLADVRPGTLVIDATNGRVDGRPTPVSARKAIESAAPQAVYVRAFNSTAWENMGDPVLDGEPVDLLWCGPDGEVAATVDALVRAVGMRPVHIGGAEHTDALDGVTAVWFALVFGRGLGRRISFRVAGLP
jgi:predicted dinucleotide-binding enzyme